MSSILENLNPEQLEAVTATEGFVRVIAGAGSGKTRALSHRFAWLVNELGILPGNILCVTFTNKSANEMRQRIHKLTGDNDTGYINTFHGFCVSILQEDCHAIGYPRRFLVLDNSDINAMLDIIYEERGLTVRDMSYKDARDKIEMRKTSLEPDYYRDMIALSLDEVKQKYESAASVTDMIFYGYLYQEKKCFGLDYNDLIKFTLYIFETCPDIRLKWQKRLEYIMIDEFQDIDQLQCTLMAALCGYHKNLFIVGDPDQTIYTWRGANVRYLLDFDKAFSPVRTIFMTKNYRSTPQILSVANALIRHNQNRMEKTLEAVLPDGQPVLCQFAGSQEEEALWIASQIRALHQNGVAYQDIAVLYRTNYITRMLEQVFLREELPHRIYNGAQFFDRVETKDALSYLRMIAFQDDLSFVRIANKPKRNLGRSRMAFLRAYATEKNLSLYQALLDNLDTDRFKASKAGKFVQLIQDFAGRDENQSVSDLLTAILHESGYEKMLRTSGDQEKLDNLAELKQSIYEFETSCGEEVTLEYYLRYIALFTNADIQERNQVKLMTIHAAKGLEFPYVFLCGLNEGIFPTRRTLSMVMMEEERRLAFVAMTRAKQRLFLSESEGRHHSGDFRYPSRFLLEIDPDLLEFSTEPPEELIQNAKAYIAGSLHKLSENQEQFAPGQRVRHAIFGTGTILEIDKEQKAHVVLFDDMETARKISFRGKLEEI